MELLLSRGADVNGRDHDAVSETMSSVGFPRTDADVMSRIDQLLAHPERMNTTRELVLGSLPRSVRGEREPLRCGDRAPAAAAAAEVTAVRLHADSKGEEEGVRTLAEVLDGGGDGRDVILNLGSYS